VVVSDASTDSTGRILEQAASRDPRIKVIVFAQCRGKSAGLNHAMRAARGQIIVFTDARQQIERGAVCRLMENFADPEVGSASGELMLGDPLSGESGKGTGLYWRIEKKIRDLESRSGSVVGATGAFYAVRRKLLVALPEDTILDDVFLPMNVVRSGARVVFDDRAHAWDVPSLGDHREFARKVRTLSGNYQLFQLAPWLFSAANPLRFEFVSHKLMRLLIPFALVAVLVTSALIDESPYRLALWAQVAFYAMSILARTAWKLGPLGRMADAASTFVTLNVAAIVAFKNFVTGNKVLWIPRNTGETR
ncbi:MAG TPA: glycosyltransferase, partial [Terriglobales bacterium]